MPDGADDASKQCSKYAIEHENNDGAIASWMVTSELPKSVEQRVSASVVGRSQVILSRAPCFEQQWGHQPCNEERSCCSASITLQS